MPNASEIQALFDRVAPVYDRLNDWLSLGSHRVWKLMAVKWSEARPGDKALDLCCGSGDLARLLAKRVGKTGEVAGVDFSPELLAIARQRTPSRSEDAPVRWVEADALALPLEDNSFDAATMGYGLRNVTDIPRALEEVHRVLAPGAKVAVLDFNRPEGSLARELQAWYLENIVVPAARQFGLAEDYAYIASSLERFPTGREQVELARGAGFADATHYAIAGGAMGVLVAEKGK